MFNPEEPYNELPDILPDERYWRTLSVLEEGRYVLTVRWPN